MRHLPASKSTRSSRSKASVALALALVVGCAAPQEVTVAPPEVKEAQKLEEIEFSKLDRFDDFALVLGEDELYLGSEESWALEVFEPLDKSVAFSSLPPQFDEQSFGAFGWETDSFAFGCLTYEVPEPSTRGRSEVVVQAMYTREDVDDETVQQIVELYGERYGEPTSALPGSRIAYWFWSKPGRRLMVATAVDPDGRKALTVAVGETQVMTLLGMEPLQAKADKDRAIQRLNAQEAPAPDGTRNGS